MCSFESYADLRGIRVSAYTSVPHRHFPQDPQQCLGWSFSFYVFLQFLIIFTFTLGLTTLQFLLLATFFSFWSAALTDPGQKIIAIREGGYALVREYLKYFKAFPALNYYNSSKVKVSALFQPSPCPLTSWASWARSEAAWTLAELLLQPPCKRFSEVV